MRIAGLDFQAFRLDRPRAAARTALARLSYIHGISRTSRVLLALAILAMVAVAAGFGWLVTTFLFAFSGGQYRMVRVVGYGVGAMIMLPLVAAAPAWILRSPVSGVVAAAVAIVAGWPLTLVIEWGISFVLGAQ